MEVSYQLTADDYRHGLMAWRALTAWRRWSIRLGIAVIGLTLILSATMLVVFRHSGPTQLSWVGVAAMSVVWLALILGNPWLAARMQFRRMPSAQGLMTVAISESGLHIRTQHGDSQVAWSAYIGWGEEKSVFVILPQPRIYVPIPKRAFTAEDRKS